MNALQSRALIIALVLSISGCASDGGSHENGNYMGTAYPSSAMYYGSGDYYYPEYIVTPRPPVDAPETPVDRPGLSPGHPIAYPPGSRLENRPSTLPSNRASSMSSQRTRSLSIPSRPRPSVGMGGMGGMRGGGMGGRGGLR